MQKQQQKPDQDQTRQRWEALVAKRLAEDTPEPEVVKELVAKGADIHLARDFVRRIAEREPEPETKTQEISEPVRPAVPMDMIVGIVLLAAGMVAGFVLYVMDSRSWGAYAGYVAMLVGLVLVGRRALTTRS
jgi:hypothetical protein